MNLTPEQAAAAEAAGCRFIPAPPDALHRYAMQRKLFRLGGQDVLATRGGGLYETASTLEQLIAIGRDRLPAPAPLAPPAAVPSADAEAEAPMAPAEAGSSAVEPEGAEPKQAETVEAAPVALAAAHPAPPAPRRRPRQVRLAPATDAPAADAAPEVPAEILLRPAARQRKPASATRWAIAGAERRGRTDQHWSKRGR